MMFSLNARAAEEGRSFMSGKYVRPVDQMILLNTGMTRDGLLLIENGEIAGPVQNFRWNDGPARCPRCRLRC